MNILFIGKKNYHGTSGVAKKMDGQINGFRQLRHEVWYLCYKNEQMILVDNKGNEETILSCKLNILNIYWLYERAIRNVLKRYPTLFQLCYIRKNACTPMHLRTLSKLKKSKVFIIEEIPTYPYDREFLRQKDILSLLYLIIDKTFRPQYKKYVDRFTSFSDDEKIFGVSTINIDNGIDLDKIPLKKNKIVKNEIRIITISSMFYWHGYDRLIRGIANYYQNTKSDTKVYLDMVGTGRCELEWKTLAKELNISKYVLFYGYKSGKELDALVDNADIAVGTLALYRRGANNAAELKIREYCARGIPFMLAATDIGLDKTCNFFLKISNNNNPVDIEELLDFLDTISKRKIEPSDIRQYAENKFAWKNILKTVIDESERLVIN